LQDKVESVPQDGESMKVSAASRRRSLQSEAQLQTAA